MRDRSIGIGLLITALVLGGLVVGAMNDTSAYCQTRQISDNNTLWTWNCSSWQQTTQADFQSGIADNVSTSANPGSVILGNQTNFPSVYGMHGAGTTFSLYNISNSTWVARQATPAAVAIGGALTYTENGNISAFQGGSTAFWEYNISTNAWRTRAVALNVVGTGAGLAYTGNGNISATRGGTQNTFWEYNISTNAWRTRAVTPNTIRAGGALAYTDNGNLSAFRGGATTFYEYNISTNVWTTKAAAPGNTAVGAALAYTENGNISALQGGTTAFWQYNISTNAWSVKAPAPAIVGTGGALAYTGDGNVSAFRGGTTTTFWRYNISTNTTTTLSNALGNIGAGGSLAYVPANPSVFTYAGTLSSVVNDSGRAGAKWYNIIWDGTINPGVTNITFQVRASDTSFLPNAALPSWVSIGWPSPVTTGLPSGRYFQWRAILTTTNPAQSPTLNDVSLCFT